MGNIVFSPNRKNAERAERMDLDETMHKLDNASRKKYYKFVYKGDGKCEICSQYDGRVFSDENLPETHPNCKCAEETDDPVDIALGKFYPAKEYYIGSKNFNATRRKLETKYGRQIDDTPHSAPQFRLGDNIRRLGYNNALYRNIAFREGKFSRPYPDGNGIPTVGVGANMTEAYIINELLAMGVISRETASELRAFGRLDKGQQDELVARLQKDVGLTEDQIQRLFSISREIAQKDAQQILSKGKWLRGKDKNGNPIMVWCDGVRDNDTWRKMPDVAKAICVDLSFNIGSVKMAKYKNFIRAVKAEDYRRAALELLDSQDFNANKDTTKGDGVAKRRRDAAIELTELAEELQNR